MYNGKKIFFSALGMVIYNDTIWFAARETNGLFRMGLHGENLEYIKSFSEEMEDFRYLYGLCTILNEQIYFAPYNANNFVVYNIKNKKFETYFLKKQIDAGYFSIINWKNQIILLPSHINNSSIVKIFLDNGEVQYIEKWIKNFCLNESQGKMFWDYCIVGNILYAPVISAKGQIMKYDLEKDEISCINTDVQENFRCICCDEKHFYLTNQCGNILTIFDKNFKKVGFEYITENVDIKINNMVYQNKHIFLFTINDYNSTLPDRIIDINIDTKEVNIICEISYKKAQNNLCELGRIFAVSTDGNNIIRALNGGNGVLYEINTLDMTICENRISTVDTSQILREKYMRTKGNIQFFEKKATCEELELLLDMINSAENFDNRDIKYGERIWEKLK